MPPCTLATRLLSFATVAMLGIFSTGCEYVEEWFDDRVTLAEFVPGRAKVSFEVAEISRAQVVLEAKSGQCPTMKDDVEAQVDEKQMDMFIRGGQQPTPKGWICAHPTFRRNVATADLGGASTRFEVADDTASVQIEATGLLQDRTISLAMPGMLIAPGVETEFAWSVDTDQIDPSLFKVDFVYDDPLLVLSAEPQTRVEGSRMFIKLPVDAPAGTGKLQADVTATVPVTTCQGVPACEGSMHTVEEVALEVDAVEPQSP